MNDMIATDNPLTEQETKTLATLVGMMIPASEAFNVPGADDDSILSEIITTAGQYLDDIAECLNQLDAVARNQHKSPFSALDEADRMAIVKESSPTLLTSITTITAQCYYRDARVMESLGMQARPPYPGGHELEQGDWSLLDPVRERGKIWRDAK